MLILYFLLCVRLIIIKEKITVALRRIKIINATAVYNRTQSTLSTTVCKGKCNILSVYLLQPQRPVLISPLGGTLTPKGEVGPQG
jgi:hypothetical protein